ncbi:unnamed protein product [Caenorhabditis angaria]|uniref:Arrestin C-terminal-like domain-containing protein n=1 Tax=Caenorhabditis angaria TaxID=860376 RepID=A0A9P1MW06_9PELO|nr:unnamed protein product [Caenorhabditis angaria]
MSLQIEFLKSPPVFQPGEKVEGFVILELDEDMKARFVEICAHGEAHAHWSESEHRSRTDSQGKTVSYSESIPYSARKEYLHIAKKSWQGEKLPRGLHKFAFSFDLPPNFLPPSFECIYGNIRYYIHVTLDRPWIWNKRSKKCFTVIPQVNLLNYPFATCYTELAAARNTGLIFKSGIVELKASIPKRGFVAGEIVPIQIHINNSSKKPIIEISIKLLQKIRAIARRGSSFHTYSPNSTHYSVKNYEKTIEKHHEQLDLPKFTKSDFRVMMKIPVTVATFEECPVIQVTYIARIKIENDEMFMSSVTCDIPLVIGTIPIFTNLAPEVSQTSEAPPPYSLNDSLPPSYEESMEKIEKDDFEPFCPIYPVFRNLPSAPPENAN